MSNSENTKPHSNNNGEVKYAPSSVSSEESEESNSIHEDVEQNVPVTQYPNLILVNSSNTEIIRLNVKLQVFMMNVNLEEKSSILSGIFKFLRGETGDYKPTYSDVLSLSHETVNRFSGGIYKVWALIGSVGEFLGEEVAGVLVTEANPPDEANFPQPELNLTEAIVEVGDIVDVEEAVEAKEILEEEKMEEAVEAKEEEELTEIEQDEEIDDKEMGEEAVEAKELEETFSREAKDE